jgi:UDP:flavonoid glycosyltransferase YjiC (YdhE family)
LVARVKFALAIHGSRGDVEPFAAVGLELQRRGHEVRIAVPHDMCGLVASSGLAPVPYGPDIHEVQQLLHDDVFGNIWTVQNPIKLIRRCVEVLHQAWADMGTALTALADGTDLLLTGMVQQGLAANVAEHYNIPVAALHSFPVRVNGQLVPRLPSPLLRSAISAFWWLHWRVTKRVENVQRRELGLAKASRSSTRRIVERGSLEIQAYDEFCFPGLASEWAHWTGQRPFIGALTLQLPTDVDDEVATWIAAGTPPIYFGFGSMPIKSPRDTVAMIAAACEQLGERALICTGAEDVVQIPHSDHVKVVRAVNHGAIFPMCRAVVHHGGAGTTAAGMRAGVSTLILWIWADQPIWAAQVKRLGVGFARRFSATTQKSLVADLRRVLAPQYLNRAREIATQMTKPDVSVAMAADLVEDAAKRNQFG